MVDWSKNLSSAISQASAIFGNGPEEEFSAPDLGAGFGEFSIMKHADGGWNQGG